ncbi:iron complex transport system permease protein [Bacillus oleivorans]|uniref:Iron complex transport system permease protein n=1 Tax=Bacillus oleivorans TaxID=1448271 RepID=A0A285D2F3_9BACI|nr:iron ABC transporter permease [Bacillus oleivorans]SNX73991.1 iron complex transport system permease protein [Bacillus oleivorans]
MFLKTYKLWAYLIASSFLIVSLIIGISLGSVQVPVSAIMGSILNEWFSASFTVDPMYESIVLSIRLPRVLLAGLIGASLAIAGAAFQGLLKNPLADPYTLGVSSGASLGAVIVLYLGISIPGLYSFTLPVLSIIFAFITILSVLLFARLASKSMSVATIILTGIIFNSFIGSFISLLIALSGDELRQIIGWLLGSVSMRGWEYILLLLPFFLIGSFILIINCNELNVLSFGEEKAKYLGVHVQHRKLWILLAASMLTGAAVAVSGTIGFVGLVIPHFTRLLWGTNHKHLLPLSMLIGAGFLILADLVSRTLISPSELPIGVITSMIGAPVFAVLLLRGRSERRGSHVKGS